MHVDLRVKHGADLRRRAAELFEIGYGQGYVARELGVPYEAVRQWRLTYGSLGLEGLLAMGAKHTAYTFEQKLAAVRDVVEAGVACADAMAAHGIASAGSLKRWCKLYREGGEEALQPKPKGRPRGSGFAGKPMTREEELEIRVRKLEAENAYLKKLAALRAERTSRTATKRPQ